MQEWFVNPDPVEVPGDNYEFLGLYGEAGEGENSKVKIGLWINKADLGQSEVLEGLLLEVLAIIDGARNFHGRDKSDVAPGADVRGPFFTFGEAQAYSERLNGKVQNEIVVDSNGNFWLVVYEEPNGSASDEDQEPDLFVDAEFTE
jgi:hypothetical protein